MSLKLMLGLAGVFAITLGLLAAADSAAGPKTLLSVAGKQILADDFKQPLSKEWKAAKGKWEVVDGVIRGSEVKADMHGAVARHPLGTSNVIIQYSFRLDGAKQTTLSINDEKGHCCRVLINAAGFTVQKDSHDKNVTDKSMVLDRSQKEIKPGEWHTIVVEIQGKELLARLDGEAVAFGAHDSIDVKKANFGLTVAGESVSFKDVKVWEATPNKDWETTKAKLLTGKK